MKENEGSTIAQCNIKEIIESKEATDGKFVVVINGSTIEYEIAKDDNGNVSVESEVVANSDLDSGIIEKVNTKIAELVIAEIVKTGFNNTAEDQLEVENETGVYSDSQKKKDVANRLTMQLELAKIQFASAYIKLNKNIEASMCIKDPKILKRLKKERKIFQKTVAKFAEFITYNTIVRDELLKE